MGNVEAIYEDFEVRVHKIEDEKMSKDDVKTVVKEDLLEQKEVEKRKLNVMCYNVLKVFSIDTMKIKTS